MSDATNGNGRTPNWFTRTVENISRALPQLRAKADEKPGDHNKRVALFLCDRWGMAYSTFRGLKVGAQGRKPSVVKHPAFFADLKRYGRAKFVGGKVDRESLGVGPDIQQYLSEIRDAKTPRAAR